MRHFSRHITGVGSALLLSATSLVAAPQSAHASTPVNPCSGTVSVYGVQADRSLTYSTVDAASGTFTGVVNSGSWKLSFTPRTMAVLNHSTILAVSTANQLWRIDIRTVSGSVGVAGTTLLGSSGWTHRLIATDGNGHLYGIAGDTLLRYDISGTKPTAATGNTTIGTGFALKTLTSTAPGWITGTTSDGRLLSYQVNGANSWVQHELRSSTWGFDALASAGDGLFLARSAGAMSIYHDVNPTAGSGNTIGPAHTVSTGGWTQSLISAEPATANCEDLGVAFCPEGLSDTGVSCNTAIAYADRQRTSATTGWNNRCLALITQSYGGEYAGVGAHYYAIESANKVSADGLMHSMPSDVTTIPRGAVVWYSNGGAGHVILSVGGGYALSTDAPTTDHVGLVPISYFTTTWHETPVGWSAPRL